MANRKLIAGNWKMNGLRASLGQVAGIGQGYDATLKAKLDLALCPPATMLFTATAALLGSGVDTGGQDCRAAASGAYTGDISAEMVSDCGARFVILGHSERRALHGESDADVAAKVTAALSVRLMAIVCVGETRAEREAGKAAAIVRRQVKRSIPDGADPARLVVAYEPVWAIGTGLTPTTADIAEIHALIRFDLVRRFGKLAGQGIRILYGGSVKPGNAAELMAVPDVDGALVGGASLIAADFLAIARGAATAAA
jgi:triosephosphate isomerase (TIM)